jgi:hypothetical protein
MTEKTNPGMTEEGRAECPPKVPSFPEQVWDVLSRTDVTEHIEWIKPKQGSKRPPICYLSWSRAWTLLKRAFPASTYAHRPDVIHADGTVEVEVDVEISTDGSEHQFTNARLGVMDNFFNPISNPTARQINDARQRALVKALAFAGLGLNLWGDTMVPVGTLDDPIDMKQIEELEILITKSESDRGKFLEWAGIEKLEDLVYERFNSVRDMLEGKLRRVEKAKAEAYAAKKKAK